MKTNGYKLIAHLYGYDIFQRLTMTKTLYIARGKRAVNAPIQDIRFNSEKPRQEIIAILCKRLFDGQHQKIFNEV